MPQRPSEAIQELKTVFIGAAFQKFGPAHPAGISLTQHCVSSVKMSHPNRDLDGNGSSPVLPGWSATWSLPPDSLTSFSLSHVFPNAHPLPCPPGRLIIETECNDSGACIWDNPGARGDMKGSGNQAYIQRASNQTFDVIFKWGCG